MVRDAVSAVRTRNVRKHFFESSHSFFEFWTDSNMFKTQNMGDTFFEPEHCCLRVHSQPCYFCIHFVVRVLFSAMLHHLVIRARTFVFVRIVAYMSVEPHSAPHTPARTCHSTDTDRCALHPESISPNFTRLVELQHTVHPVSSYKRPVDTR